MCLPLSACGQSFVADILQILIDLKNILKVKVKGKMGKPQPITWHCLKVAGNSGGNEQVQFLNLPF